MQEVLQEDLDEKDDYQGTFQAPWGRRRRRRSSRRRRRRRRGWFRKVIRKTGNFIKKHAKTIWNAVKKYHKCCTTGACVGKKYCYTEWFKKKHDIGAQYENSQKELLLRELEDAGYDVYEDERK